MKLENTNNKPTYKNIYLIIIISILALISVAVSIAVIIKSSISGSDLLYYWRNSAYSIRGYNLEWLESSQFEVPGIGIMPEGGIGVLPYGRLLIQFIVPGFLSFYWSRIYYRIILICLLVIIIKCSAELISQCGFSGKISYYVAIILCLLPWIWGGFLRAGNIGGILALVVVCMTFSIRKHENITAFLLALSLIKPQVGGIIFIMFFFTKKYKLLIKTSLICLICDLSYRGYVLLMNTLRHITTGNTNALASIFSQRADQSMNSESEGAWYLYYGLFNMLRNFGVPSIVVLALSMLAGIIFVYIFLRIIKNAELKNICANKWIIPFAIAELASLFWFYKSECDSLVLIGCNLLIPIYWNQSAKKNTDILWSILYILGTNSLIGRYGLRFVIPVISYHAGILVDQLLQIIAFSLMIYFLLKKNNEPKVGKNFVHMT